MVIDKLPFAPPDDPVLAARLEALEREGAIPSSTTIASCGHFLKQGREG